MKLRKIFFPAESRRFFGKRWLNVIFRSLHLCGTGVYTGGVFFDVAPELICPSYLVSSLSGLAIMGMDLYCNGKWVLQNRGLFVLTKLILLGILPHIGEYQKWGILVIIVLSSLIAHATADFRYYSLFYRRRI
jgi:hypothetical protein